jgi:alginate O-acetyltransferase complex protein AlgI
MLYLRSMFFGGAGLCSGTFLYYLRSFAPGLLVMIVVATPLAKTLYRRLPEKLTHILNPILVLVSLLLCTAYLVDSTYNPFLYFRF